MDIRRIIKEEIDDFDWIGDVRAYVHQDDIKIDTDYMINMNESIIDLIMCCDKRHYSEYMRTASLKPIRVSEIKHETTKEFIFCDDGEMERKYGHILGDTFTSVMVKFLLSNGKTRLLWIPKEFLELTEVV
jgi:hypothetical protein